MKRLTVFLAVVFWMAGCGADIDPCSRYVDCRFTHHALTASVGLNTPAIPSFASCEWTEVTRPDGGSMTASLYRVDLKLNCHYWTKREK